MLLRVPGLNARRSIRFLKSWSTYSVPFSLRFRQVRRRDNNVYEQHVCRTYDTNSPRPCKNATASRGCKSWSAKTSLRRPGTPKSLQGSGMSLFCLLSGAKCSGYFALAASCLRVACWMLGARGTGWGLAAARTVEAKQRKVVRTAERRIVNGEGGTRTRPYPFPGHASVHICLIIF